MWIDDEILHRCAEPLALSCWVPERPMVVLGSSNQAEAEVAIDRCQEDGVPILKRYGGGGTVLLYPGCLVVSLGTWVRQPFQSKHYFDLANRSVISALAQLSSPFAKLDQRGLSDITFGERKVAGTSLFRSRNYLLYQASLLGRLDLGMIDRYLSHPSREPEYRAGRNHRDFLLGLEDIDPTFAVETICTVLEQKLTQAIVATFGEELVMPAPEQFATLLKRATAKGPDQISVIGRRSTIVK